MDEKNDARDVTSEILFIRLISMFQVAAMQQMGKVMNPLTNKIERDMEQAKMSIDMIAMIKKKSEGNLGDMEEEFLDKVLFELRMNYIGEVERPEEKEKADVGASAEVSGNSQADGKAGAEESPKPGGQAKPASSGSGKKRSKKGQKAPAAAPPVSKGRRRTRKTRPKRKRK